MSSRNAKKLRVRTEAQGRKPPEEQSSRPRRRELSWFSAFTVGSSNLKWAKGIQFDNGQRVSPALNPQG